jgi:Na+/H+ antiporter NhaD/arsenite permease-like protein
MLAEIVSPRPDAVALAGVPLEFVLFVGTLVGVALFHRHTLRVALIGLVALATYKATCTGSSTGRGVSALVSDLAHEWVILANLLCLLMGFAVLSRHFEKSHIPVVLPKFLPGDWKGAFAMLVIVFVLSSFLDNIAAALIGGAMAHQLFRAKVHVAYLAAVVGASNAGGAWSVIGDTTTTMMWIGGVSPAQVFAAIVPSAVALMVFGIPAAMRQHKHSPILERAHEHTQIDWTRVWIVALILVLSVATNVVLNLKFPEQANGFPFIGVAVWVVIFASAGVRRPDWEVLPRAFRGSMFLIALVLSASMLPLQKLPVASWHTAFSLGVVSAVFDNIPLTAVALKQGDYDWAFLAHAVGFGGSMVWFGSSAGVALANMYPEAKSVGRWLRDGWYIPVAYVIGFVVLLATFTWRVEPPKKPTTEPDAPLQSSASVIELVNFVQCNAGSAIYAPHDSRIIARSQRGEDR